MNEEQISYLRMMQDIDTELELPPQEVRGIKPLPADEVGRRFERDRDSGTGQDEPICQECGEPRPGDERVDARLKCRFCAY